MKLDNERKRHFQIATCQAKPFLHNDYLTLNTSTICCRLKAWIKIVNTHVSKQNHIQFLFPHPVLNSSNQTVQNEPSSTAGFSSAFFMIH